jgi:four helix bundle protein
MKISGYFLFFSGLILRKVEPIKYIIMELSELEVYIISMNLSNQIWNFVKKWSFFEKDTIGKQIVRSSDSVSANISEGFGRYYFKDSKAFLFYARGSLYETKTWLKKAQERDLINNEEFNELNERYTKLGVKLNNYIRVIGKTNSNLNSNDQ